MHAVIPGDPPENEETRRADVREALERADKRMREREAGAPPLPSELPLPNYGTGPGRPRPMRINFYRMSDNFPDYLQCQYDVSEKRYDESDEPKWF